jgi:Pectinacetylesterase
MRRRLARRLTGWALALLAGALPLAAQGIGIEDVVDGGNTYAWQQIELPGTVCGNGSQYKFYVYDSPSSTNLLVLFEGGGACWDYPSCSGQTGILGAAHPNGIPDNYMAEFEPQYVSPLVNGADPGIPLRPKNDISTKGWDVVYMPYCTGDVHLGNNVVTYTDPTGQNPPVTWRHAGYQNTKAAMNYLHTRFPSINKLLVTGFSAGGTATSATYYTVRRTLLPAKGYLLNDSGPIYPAPNATYKSRPLHDTIKAQWNLTSLYNELPATFNPNDFGSINDVVAQEFPSDRLAYTAYSSDYNYSRFSYERFYPGITQATVLSYWRTDQANLINKLKTYSNFSYHVPWHRPINDSHCSSIITFIGSHACPTVRKKKWYEVLEWPWTQSWKCPSGFTPFETFLSKWLDNNQQVRIVEPENYYNNEDPGMQIVAPLINDALAGA